MFPPPPQPNICQQPGNPHVKGCALTEGCPSLWRCLTQRRYWSHSWDTAPPCKPRGRRGGGGGGEEGGWGEGGRGGGGGGSGKGGRVKTPFPCWYLLWLADSGLCGDGALLWLCLDLPATYRKSRQWVFHMLIINFDVWPHRQQIKLGIWDSNKKVTIYLVK